MKTTTEAGTAQSRRPAGWLVRLWRSIRLLDAVLLTSVPLLAVLLLIGDGVVRSAEYAHFDDYWTQQASLATFVSDRAAAVFTLPRRVALRQRLSPDSADPGIIRIDVPQRSWDAMQRDSQAMWGEWIDAILAYGATRLDVRVRKRGDNSIHWLTDKRSFTVRTSRDEFYKRYREFGLSGKDVLPSYLANRLAGEFGLLVPDTAVVPVYLNNQFYGMFRLVEVVDESFLRSMGRMPGNIFRGDTAERAEAHKSAPRNLFENPYIWDRVAVNDRVTAAPPDQLQSMLEDLAGGTFEDHERLMSRVDREEYARLFAYFMVMGDPFHSSGVHNQFLYEDPSTQRLHPIPWDIRLRDVTVPGVGFNDLFRELLRDPWLTDQIMSEVGRRLDDPEFVVAAERLVVDAETRYLDYFLYDRLRTGLVPDVGTATQAWSMIRANLDTLRDWAVDDTIATGVTYAGGLQVLDFETRGRTGANLTALEGVGQGGRPRLFRDANRNGILDETDPEVPARLENDVLVLDQPVPLLAAWDTSRGSFDPGRMTYRLFLTEPGDTRVRPQLTNRVTGEPAAATEFVPGQVLATSTAWHPWRRIERVPETHRYSGDVRLAATVRIPRGDTVLIAAGTTLRLDPDVSFVSEGLVRLEGTPERPVRILPAVPERPWGAFSLQGSGADGSVVRNAEFIGGGGALVSRVEYIGMVNVHRARGVVFDHVLFARNRRSDDTFHALHADITLTNSRFVEANSDAVDLDMSTGEIRDNQFEGSGGDAIDLMTSSPRIIGNHIRDAGDKGISVGEASSPVIFANVIEGAVSGIEVKDDSAPVVLNNEIRRSDVGLGSHAKNWRYGGSGFAFVANTLFEDNTTSIDADVTSRLTLVAVAGLDGVAATELVPAPLTWLYARLGLGVDGLRIGLPERWRITTPAAPVEAFQFVDDFETVADGWTRGPWVTRLEKRHGVLVVEAEGGVGTVGRYVSWDFSTTSGGVLVLELAGRDVQRVRVEVEGELGIVERLAEVGSDPDLFSVVEVRLPPDRYRRVTVELDPTSGLSHIQRSTGLSVIRAGRLLLRSVAVYMTGGDER